MTALSLIVTTGVIVDGFYCSNIKSNPLGVDLNVFLLVYNRSSSITLLT